MSVASPPNPAHLILEITWLNFEGGEKLDVVTSTVTVFHRTALGARVVDLAPVPQTLDAATSMWRFVWVLPIVAAGQYVVEYRGTDTDGAVGVVQEDLTVYALAVQVDEVLDCLLGRQKLDVGTNRWILFRRDGSVLKEFDVKDDVGAPSSDDVFDRIPVP